MNTNRTARQLISAGQERTAARAAVAVPAIRPTAGKLMRTAKAVFAVCRRHVPAWMGAVLTVCLFIPGPLDELVVLLAIASMVVFKPAMRADMGLAISQAWED
jgi:hypothetical protein